MSHKKQSDTVKIFGTMYTKQSVPAKSLPVNTKNDLPAVPDRVAL